jgi:hypothetical protein
MGLCISDDYGNRSAKRFFFKHAGKYLWFISFGTCGGSSAASGPPPGEFAANFFYSKGNAGGTAVDDRAQRRAVRFAECGNRKEFTKYASAQNASFIEEFPNTKDLRPS